MKPKFTSMNISLPREQKGFVDQRVARGGFGTVSDYVRDLIRRDERDLVQDELERKLLEGLASGPAEVMKPREWALIRREVKRRAHSRKRASKAG